ncbi:ABC transporter substrate-binding protein, partial [Streptomyces sp. SID7982]|nr:ABC transporter substrate-binding protein [Streptomyces sp. SID7982]
MSSHRLRLLVVAAALVGVSACGGSSDTGNKDDESRSGGAFPLTVEHALGKTTIPAKPERVA